MYSQNAGPFILMNSIIVSLAFTFDCFSEQRSKASIAAEQFLVNGLRRFEVGQNTGTVTFVKCSYFVLSSKKGQIVTN